MPSATAWPTDRLYSTKKSWRCQDLSAFCALAASFQAPACLATIFSVAFCLEMHYTTPQPPLLRELAEHSKGVENGEPKWVEGRGAHNAGRSPDDH